MVKRLTGRHISLPLATRDIYSAVLLVLYWSIIGCGASKKLISLLTGG